MILLLDTHALVWVVTDSRKLSPVALAAVETPANRVCVSTVSLWEIAIKFGLGKLDLQGLIPEDLPALIEVEGYEILSPEPVAVASSYRLPKLGHKDPYDRMLAWQAICGGLTLVSVDAEMRAYEAHGLRLLW